MPAFNILVNISDKSLFVAALVASEFMHVANRLASLYLNGVANGVSYFNDWGALL